MSYRVMSGGNLLWVIVTSGGNLFGLLCVEWCNFYWLWGEWW